MGSKAAKEKIVSDNTGLVWSIARRFVNRGYDLEELYQIGCIGLLKACDRFESRYGVQFSTYAVPLIAGEIKRFLRDNGAIKQTICGKDGTQVSLVERLVDEAQSEVAAENIMNRILVGQAMEKLGEMEQELIRLRFFEDRTQTEVAKVLGISQVQVSRLEKKILIQMRQNLDFYKSN